MNYPTDQLSICLSHQNWMSIMKLYNEHIKAFTSHLKQAGLNPTQFEVLHLILTQQPIDQKTIAEHLHLTQGNITHCIQKLQSLELIICQKEWKRNLLCLNEKGKALMNQLIPQQHKLMGDALKGLTPAQQESLNFLLSQFEHTCQKEGIQHE